ncbi:MAG: CrcB family protein [Actinomycetales bacterium]|nr:CrcB family protein [Actinomycetales bacterium]
MTTEPTTPSPTAPGESGTPGAPGALTLFALVALGGMLGGLARTGALELAGPDLGASALAAVNVLGSGLLGLLVGTATPRVATWLRPFAGTGILGGFTTYSAAMATLAQLEADNGWASAAGYLALSLAGCVLAAAAGLALGLRVARGGGSAADAAVVADGEQPGTHS